MCASGSSCSHTQEGHKGSLNAGTQVPLQVFALDIESTTCVQVLSCVHAYASRAVVSNGVVTQEGGCMSMLMVQEVDLYCGV